MIEKIERSVDPDFALADSGCVV